MKMPSLAPDAELSSDMVDAIYKIQPVELMGMETTAIDLTDETWYGYLAGLTADNVGKGGRRRSQRADDRQSGVQPGAAATSGQRPMPRDRRFDGGKHQHAQVGLRGAIRPAWSALMISCCMSWQTVELVDVDLLADAAAKAFDATFDVDDSSSMRTSELPPGAAVRPAVAVTIQKQRAVPFAGHGS